MINIAIIDQQVAVQGRFCLIDWLLGDNLLFHQDYESWRNGELEYLIDKLKLDLNELVAIMANVKKHCHSLGLVAEPQDFLCWSGENTEKLRASKNADYHQSLTEKWLRPQDQPQLDLFMDNSAQLAEADVLLSISNRQFEQAQTKLQVLSDLNPSCSRLGGYQDLINYGCHMVAMPDIETEALATEQEGLKQEVVPLAQDILGADARDYLTFAWRRIARACQLPFDAEQSQLSPSAALMEIPDYAAALAALESDPALDSQPVLLERYAICLSRLHQKEKSLLVWCVLMELDADYAQAAIEGHTSEKINALWLDFCELDDEWNSAYFSAYVLIRNPALIHQEKLISRLKNKSSVTTINLLKVRASGGSEIEARGELQRINPQLLKIYLGLNRAR